MAALKDAALRRQYFAVVGQSRKARDNNIQKYASETNL